MIATTLKLCWFYSRDISSDARFQGVTIVEQFDLPRMILRNIASTPQQPIDIKTALITSAHQLSLCTLMEALTSIAITPNNHSMSGLCLFSRCINFFVRTSRACVCRALVPSTQGHAIHFLGFVVCAHRAGILSLLNEDAGGTLGVLNVDG